MSYEPIVHLFPGLIQDYGTDLIVLVIFIVRKKIILFIIASFP